MLVTYKCGCEVEIKKANKQMVARAKMQKCPNCSGAAHNKRIWDYALTQDWSSEQMNAYYQENKI